MGLFGKKDPCAICGGKVKGLMPWKIEGQYVCNECYGVVDLPNNATNNMTIEEFRGYMTFREENKQLKEQFQVTQQIDFGLFDTKFMFDTYNRLLCMDKHLNKTIFEGGQIKSFIIREDSAPLFEGNASGLYRYTSTVPERTMAMAPQINQYVMQMQMQRDMERMIDRMDGDNSNNNNNYRRTNSVNFPEPFDNFYVEIEFEHPYWTVFTADMSGPKFDNTRPDVNDFLRVYQDRVVVMEDLAQALMALAFPTAPEKVMGAANTTAFGQVTSVSGANVDVVEEIQRFKSLMEQGILTEEEFTAKKRQLLGL